jgi:hypothetical protein
MAEAISVARDERTASLEARQAEWAGTPTIGAKQVFEVCWLRGQDLLKTLRWQLAMKQLHARTTTVTSTITLQGHPTSRSRKFIRENFNYCH